MICLFKIETSVLHFIHHSMSLHAKGLFPIDNGTLLQVMILNFIQIGLS